MAHPSASTRVDRRTPLEKTVETNIENSLGDPAQAPKLSAGQIQELRDLVRVVREAAEEERRAPTSRSRALASRALRKAVRSLVDRSMTYGFFSVWSFGLTPMDALRVHRWGALGNAAKQERTRLDVEGLIRKVGHAESDRNLRRALVQLEKLDELGQLDAVARDVARDMVARMRAKPSRAAEIARQYVPAIVQRAAYLMSWFEFGRSLKGRKSASRPRTEGESVLSSRKRP